MARMEIILEVASVEDTVEWYESVLGWEGNYDVYDKDNNCLFGEVATNAAKYEKDKGRIGFNLSRSPGRKPIEGESTWQALIYVDDVQQVYKSVMKKGCKITSDLMDQPWGGRTFTMNDLNGVRLQFAQMIESPSLEEIQKRLDLR